MGSIFFLMVVTATMAWLPMPVRAEENAAPPTAPAPAQAPAQAPAEAPAQVPGQPAPEAKPPLTQPQDAEKNRFVFHRIDGGVLRLDTVTGAVDSCTQSGTGLTCVPGHDERTALDREIAQLQHDNAVLKNALLEHGVPMPAGMAPGPRSGAGNWRSGDETIPRPPQTVPPTAAAPEGTPGAPQGAPPESAIDRIVDAVEKGWRRLVEMMTNLRRELER